MKFKIPNSINVFGSKYKVKMVDTVLFSGLCDPNSKAIFINVNQSEDQVVVTFWHEVMHAMQFTLGMDNAISKEMMEMLAENSANLIVQILSANKK